MGGLRRAALGGAALVAIGLSMPVISALAPAALSNPLLGSNRLPNGWALDPAGTQVITDRAPTGLTVSPDGKTVYAVTSGIFTESIDAINTEGLVATPTPVSSAFEGVALDSKGHLWVSSGPSNRVFQYLASGSLLVDLDQAGVVPSSPNRGIPVSGYPGTMTLSGNHLFVAGTIDMPQTAVETADGNVPCPASDVVAGVSDTICSVVNVLQVAPTLQNPSGVVVKAIPVGRDAFGLAYRPESSTLYVSNFADQTNPNTTRGSGSGTVSVVHVNADGTGHEVTAVPVGKGPAGIALAPDHSLLAVANSSSDTVNVLSLGADGSVTANQPVSVGLPGMPLGTTPLSVTFTPDGKELLVALAGIDAVEVLSVAGGTVSPIAQSVAVPGVGTIPVPATFIPTGWYPDALATGPEPVSSVQKGIVGTRLYVANLKGNGAGPGLYEQLEPLVGSSTEGTVSAIDLPSDPGALATDLASWTARVVNGDRLAPVYDTGLQSSDPASNACAPVSVPGEGAVTSTVLCDAAQGTLDRKSLHVVTILAENKTFDSYFGDTHGTLHDNGNSLYTEFPAQVTTNQHDLAKQYTLSDDFWNEGAESSVLGHSWWSGGVATPDNELTWGQSYDQGLRGNRGSGQYAPGTSGSVSGVSISGPSDPNVAAVEQVMLSPHQVLADEVAGSGTGLTARVFATDVTPGSTAPSDVDQVPQGPWGEGPSSPVSSDLAFPDADRANVFISGSTISHAWDLFDGPSPPATFGKTIGFPAADVPSDTLNGWTATYDACIKAGGSDEACQGQSMPNYVYMTLPENHTYVVSNVFNPLDPTPQSMVADNDYAIGKVVSALSKSPFWKNTVVFISEDDNQFTGDHVDIHRTFLLTTGGLARQLGLQATVSHQQSSFASVLKTTEILLGLQPLTLFDRLAAPLQDTVTSGATAPPYNVVTPDVPFLGNTSLPGSGSLP